MARSTSPWTLLSSARCRSVDASIHRLDGPGQQGRGAGDNREVELPAQSGRQPDYQIQVTDNKASNLPDTNINLFGFGPGDVGCPVIEVDEVPITAGNFKVRDAIG